jgi:NAD(P)-dependent dehydrogenase (short-subunit alcohol dehydrogenase family)
MLTRPAIINVSSGAGTTGVRGGAHYSSAKAALQMFTRVTAAEWGPRGIRCNCVAVGLVASERAVAAWETAGLDAQDMAATKPTRRLGRPEEIALPILFLASARHRLSTARPSSTVPTMSGPGPRFHEQCSPSRRRLGRLCPVDRPDHRIQDDRCICTNPST